MEDAQGTNVSELDPSLLENPSGYVSRKVKGNLVDSLEVCEENTHG
jgi:hypothetical protein